MLTTGQILVQFILERRRIPPRERRTASSATARTDDFWLAGSVRDRRLVQRRRDARALIGEMTSCGRDA